jgi:hypothetical protein
MIGLSWRSGFGDPDVAKVDTGMDTIPLSGACHAWRSTFVKT